MNETFTACTPSNKAAVEAELKQAIFKAFESNQLWTIDWPNYKLKACAHQPTLHSPTRLGLADPPRSLGRRLNPKKRFLPSTPATNGVKAGLSSDGVDDDDRRAKRAMRFVSNANRNGAGPSGGGTLGDRLGLNGAGGFGRVAQAGKHGYGGNNMYGTPEPEAVYDPVSTGTLSLAFAAT